MASDRKTTEPEDVYKSRFQKFGFYLLLIFYFSSVAYVHFLGKNRGAFDPKVKIITVGHSSLEDGFREGFDEVARRFEKIKAEQGEKVKVIQTTVPWRGYRQWFMSQMIGENPMDVVALLGTSQMYNQYFRPLSSYLGEENPFNKGTALEGIPWKDTYIDNMVSALDETYAEYFGIGRTFSVYRLHANLDLLEKATGSRKMPEDLNEWMICCQKLKDYGEKAGRPVIPIGIRGCDRATVANLFMNYYSQTSGNLVDDNSLLCDGRVFAYDIFQSIKDKSIDRNRILAAVEIIREIGQYFAQGFNSIDLEQTKFLFCSGLVGFFPEGSFNAYSLVKNSPFEVGIAPIPPIGYKHRLSKYYTGKVTEYSRVLGLMGIPKSSKHFDLSLEFLQFMSSYEMNQLLMGYCKYPPAVKNAEFKGIVRHFKPVQGEVIGFLCPFYYDWYSSSHIKFLGILENIALENPKNSGDYLMEELKKNKNFLIRDLEEGLISFNRSKMDREMQRSQISVGLLPKNISDSCIEQFRLRSSLADESYSEITLKELTVGRFLKQMKEF